MNHAVQDGVLIRVSPSQIKTYQDCARKWYYDKVQHVPVPDKPHLQLGESIHRQLEEWYLNGIPPEHESIARALNLAEVPERFEPVIIEEPRDYELGLRAAGVLMRGRLDMLVPPVDARVMVLDWKSTRSWNWVKTPEQLERDAQGITYLKYAFQKYPEAVDGVFRHVYIRTHGGHGARAVTTDPLTRDYVDEMYEGLERVVEQMKGAAGAATPLDVEPNPKECEKYGGCPYRSICPVTKRVSTFLDFADVENTMTLAEKIRMKKAAEINPPDAAKPDVVEKYVPPTPTGDHSIPEDIIQAQSTPFLHLYVDCQPVKGEGINYIPLESVIAQRTPALLDQIRQVEPNALPAGAVDLREAKYGIGVAKLAADLKRNPPMGVVTASSFGLSGIVLEVLIPLASVVVKGNR